MIDKAYLKYMLESHGITRQDLMEAQGWSHTTYTRKVINAMSSWTVPEVQTLERLGIPTEDLNKIFFES